MPKFYDLTGLKFGKLTVIEQAPQLNPKNRNTRWVCVCECGNETTTTSQKLRTGYTKSCGCLREGKYARTHGFAMKPGPTYRTWLNMRTRCNNPKATQYADYGGRGIRVCERWDSFENFLADMGERKVGWEIDRIDFNGHYEPGNCRWIKRGTGRKRNQIIVTLNGEEVTLGRAAHELGLDYQALHKLVYRRRVPFGEAVARLKAKRQLDK
jgi:hypothetical protein